MGDQRSTPTRCPHCGRELEPLTVIFGGDTLTVGHRACTCPDAQREAEELERQQREELKREEQRRVERAIAASGIPERYREATTDRDDLVALAEKSGLYIQGPVGTGKTELACAIGIRLIEEGRKVLFVKAADLVDMMSGFDTGQEAVASIKAPFLLIIDDIGMTIAKDWSDKRLRRAIDARWDSAKPVIVTSNYSKQELYEVMAKSDEQNADAVLSRLFGMTEKVELKGKDRRLS